MLTERIQISFQTDLFMRTLSFAEQYKFQIRSIKIITKHDFGLAI